MGAGAGGRGVSRGEKLDDRKREKKISPLRRKEDSCHVRSRRPQAAAVLLNVLPVFQRQVEDKKREEAVRKQ